MAPSVCARCALISWKKLLTPDWLYLLLCAPRGSAEFGIKMVVELGRKGMKILDS